MHTSCCTCSLFSSWRSFGHRMLHQNCQLKQRRNCIKWHQIALLNFTIYQVAAERHARTLLRVLKSLYICIKAFCTHSTSQCREFTAGFGILKSHDSLVVLPRLFGENRVPFQVCFERWGHALSWLSIVATFYAHEKCRGHVMTNMCKW